MKCQCFTFFHTSKQQVNVVNLNLNPRWVRTIVQVIFGSHINFLTNVPDQMKSTPKDKTTINKSFFLSIFFNEDVTKVSHQTTKKKQTLIPVD